jgi:hypothetical protein
MQADSAAHGMIWPQQKHDQQLLMTQNECTIQSIPLIRVESNNQGKMLVSDNLGR